MAYIGNIPAEAYTNTVKDSFNGNGSTTAFTLSRPTVTNDVRVVVENVIQDPTVAYSVSGTTLTFTSAPPAGTGNIYVVHLGPAVMTAIPPSEIADATTFASSVTVQGAFTSLGIDDNATSTAMTLDSSGNLLVGMTSANTNNDGVGLRADGLIHGKRAGVVATFNRKTSDGAVVEISKDNTVVGSIGIDSGDNITFGATSGGGSGLFMFGSGGTSPFILPMKEGALSDNTVTLGDNSRRFKDLYLSGGVYLGGTGSANHLDDYEEGTWTPSWKGGDADGTASGTFTGTYTKVGRLVYCSVNIQAANLTGASGALLLRDLPFTVSSTAAATGAGTAQLEGVTAAWLNGTPQAGSHVQVMPGPNTVLASFRVGLSINWDSYLSAASTFTSGNGSTYGKISFTYQTD